MESLLSPSPEAVLRPAPHWRVWACVDALLLRPSSNHHKVPSLQQLASTPQYHNTRQSVGHALEQVALQYAGCPSWASFLNKSQLGHELEECILALHPLLTFLLGQKRRRFLVVDVCAGKGVLSFVLAQLLGLLEKEKNEMAAKVSRIVLLEKSTTIDWHHIHETKQTTNTKMEIWSGTNLHDYDHVLDRLQDELARIGRENVKENGSSSSCLPPQICLIGIHLCKMLSPTLISLAHGLGPEQCPYLCLAPCCLPNAVLQTNPNHRKNKTKHKEPKQPRAPITSPNDNGISSSSSPSKTIEIQLYETPTQRAERLAHNQQTQHLHRKHRFRGRGSNVVCWKCHQPGHGVRECPLRTTENDGDSTSCWACGQAGHTAPACPQNKWTPQYPPSTQIQVASVFGDTDPNEALLSKNDPFARYCQLLASHIQLPCVQVVEAGKTTSEDQTAERVDDDKPSTIQHHSNDHGGNRNWNHRRKSIYIVATNATTGEAPLCRVVGE